MPIRAVHDVRGVWSVTLFVPSESDWNVLVQAEARWRSHPTININTVAHCLGLRVHTGHPPRPKKSTEPEVGDFSTSGWFAAGRSFPRPPWLQLPQPTIAQYSRSRLMPGIGIGDLPSEPAISGA